MMIVYFISDWEHIAFLTSRSGVPTQASMGFLLQKIMVPILHLVVVLMCVDIARPDLSVRSCLKAFV